MMEFLRVVDGKIEKLKSPVRNTWINVVSPDDEEIKKLKDVSGVPEDFIRSLKDFDEIPMIDKENGFLFIIIRTPKKSPGTGEMEYSTMPLGVILSDEYIITVSFVGNDAIDKLKTMKLESKKSRLFLQLLLTSTKLSLHYLKDIQKDIYTIQKDLEKSTKNAEIIKLLGIEKSLVYFNTSLRSNGFLVGKLLRRRDIAGTEEDKDLIDDILDENRQAVRMTTIYSDILSGMMDAFTSVISNNLNRIMKTLTSVTIILMIPTLVASIYGMNVELPFQNGPNAFVITMLISVALSLVGVAIFWRRELF